jgi:hypothetical protein
LPAGDAGVAAALESAGSAAQAHVAANPVKVKTQIIKVNPVIFLLFITIS